MVSLISDKNSSVPLGHWLFPALYSRAPATPGKICVISAVLGAVTAFGLVLFALPVHPRLGLYLVDFGLFHLLEFYVTSRNINAVLTVNSFLLTNGPLYVIAHILALFEYFYTSQFRRHGAEMELVGAFLAINGQVLRTVAMLTASSNFNHVVQFEKNPEHQLVTTSVYGLVRHPSYLAYLLWAIGNQLILNNQICTVVYGLVLWCFFRKRIASEECALIRFFGDEYRKYKQRIPSGIIFVKGASLKC